MKPPAAQIRAVLLALPLAGLGWAWYSTDQASRQGVEWDVPVQGYDPRDLLRGHYVEFQYEWPGLDEGDSSRASFPELCLIGQAPRLDRVSRPAEGVESAKPCANYARADEVGNYGSGSLAEGRLYASQAQALRLQEQLWDRKQQGFIRIRLRPDGHITPLRMTFRPRPPEPVATE